MCNRNYHHGVDATVVVNVYDTVIFDLDDTLYQNPDLSDRLTELTKRWIAEELGLSDHRVEALYGWLPTIHPHPYDGYASLGLPIEGYFEHAFRRVPVSEYVDANPELVALCSEIDVTTAVVSLGPRDHCQRVLDALGFSDEIDGVYNPYQDADAYDKAAVYERFSDDATLVVGDSYANDLQPAVELGFDVVHVTEACNREVEHSCIDDVSELKSVLERRAVVTG